MKRLIVFALVLSVAMFSTFAAQAVEFTDATAFDEIRNQATLDLQFKIDENTGSFKFGFNSNDKHEKMTSNTLNLVYADKVVKNTSPLYIWWDIVYGGKYNLTLAIDGPLTNDEQLSNNKIAIEVSKADAAEDAALLTTTVEGSSQTLTTNILTQNDGTTIASASGEQSLAIESTSDIDGLAEGTYSATLTLKLTTD